MSILTTQHRQWTRVMRQAAATVTAAVIGGLAARAQSGDLPVRVLDVERKTMQQEISTLAQANFDIALVRLHPGLLIAQQGRESVPRAYLFVDDLQTFLAGKRLEPGYRLLPQSLSPGGKPYCAVFEKREHDDQLHEYAFVKGSSAGDLEKKARKSLGNGFVPVAVNTEGEAIAIFERRPDAGPWKLLATKSTATMEKELAAAAAEGYRVVAAAGGIELTYALVQPLGAQPIESRLLSATLASTLERELNDAAAQGFRLVPTSLAALKGGFFFRATNEGAIVLEKSEEPAVTYRIVGARRVSTIEKEANEPATQGFTIVAALLGYEETVVILAAPRATTTTVR